MKKTVFFLLLMASLSFSVPVLQNYDYFIHLKNTGELYSALKKLPLFEFLFLEGVGYEETVVEWVESRLNDPEEFFQGISSEIVICGKGDISNLFTLDINEILSLSEKINGFIAFKTPAPERFIEDFAKVKDRTFIKRDDLYVLGNTTPLFSKISGNYVLISSTETVFEKIGESEDTTDKPFFARIKKMSVFGREGEVEIVGQVKESHLTVEITQKASPFRVSAREDIGKLPYLGDLFAFTSDPEILRWFFMNMFRGSDVEKFFNTISSEGSSMFLVSLYGTPRFAFLMENKTLDEVTSDLVSRGAKFVGEELQLDVGGLLLHFFDYNGKLVVSSMKKVGFLQTLNRKRLENHPSFVFLEKEVPKSVFLEVFVDLYTLFDKLLGFSPRSSLLLIGYEEDGLIKYRLEVM
jgi:hypothetical protein